MISTERARELEVAKRIEEQCKNKMTRKVTTEWIETKRQGSSSTVACRRIRHVGKTDSMKREDIKRETRKTLERRKIHNTRVREIVLQSKVGTHDLAIIMGRKVKDTSINQWLRGEHNYRNDVLKRIEDACSRKLANV